jgi:hypothetical protein
MPRHKPCLLLVAPNDIAYDQTVYSCAANAFARDGHTVLVYSPRRGQIEPIASEFRKIADQGYFTHIRRELRPAAANTLRSRADGSSV